MKRVRAISAFCPISLPITRYQLPCHAGVAKRVGGPPINHSKSKICPTRYALPVTSYLPQRLRRQSKIQNPASKIFLSPIHPVAVFATTPGSGFVEMILHPLLIQHPKSNISASATRYHQPATAATPLIHHPKSTSMLPDARHFDFCVVKR